MRRLIIICFTIAAFSSGCYKNPNQERRVDISGGKRAFGAIPPTDSKKYLLMQEALLRANLSDSSVKIELFDNRLQLNIPGDIGFSINSADINWNMHQILDGITPVLKEFPHTKISITGHSDSRGNPVLNQQLSEQRAASIGRYFIRSKISQDRVITKGVGQTQPITTNDTARNRSLNRRFTLEITVPQDSSQP